MKGNCTRSFCDYWHPPESQFYKTESGFKFGDKCSFPHPRKHVGISGSSAAFENSRSPFFIHPEQFGTFPERLALPKPDEEILSGYEEGVRDGFLAWVKADAETILRRHVVDARGLYPAFREEPARRYGPSSQQCQLNDEVPNRLTEQRRLSVYNWTMRNLSWEGERGERRFMSRVHFTSRQLNGRHTYKPNGNGI